MRWLMALLLLVCVACSASGSADVYDWKHTRTGGKDIQVDTSVSYPHQSVAINLIKALFEVRFNVDLSKAKPVVYWTTTVCPYPWYRGAGKIPAVVYEKECLHGGMFTCDEIYVAAWPKLHETALVHELTHCFLQHIGGDGGPTHSLREWWNWGDAVVNIVLKDNESRW